MTLCHKISLSGLSGETESSFSVTFLSHGESAHLLSGFINLLYYRAQAKVVLKDNETQMPAGFCHLVTVRCSLTLPMAQHL